MNNPIRIDVAARTIRVMTKTFAAKAFCYGTQEYEMLRAVRADYQGQNASTLIVHNLVRVAYS